MTKLNRIILRPKVPLKINNRFTIVKPLRITGYISIIAISRRNSRVSVTESAYAERKPFIVEPPSLQLG